MSADVAPQEFRRIGYILEFDENGDVVPSGEFPDYVVYSYNNELPQPVSLTLHYYSTHPGNVLLYNMHSCTYTTCTTVQHALLYMHVVSMHSSINCHTHSSPSMH